MMKIERLDKQGYRKFGVTTALIILLLFGLFLPWLFFDKYPSWPETFAEIPFMISYALASWAVVHPSSLSFIYIPWMQGAHFLGAVNSRILLFIIYYALFTPCALILRLISKDFMDRKILARNTDCSYWKSSQQKQTSHMEHNY